MNKENNKDNLELQSNSVIVPEEIDTESLKRMQFEFEESLNAEQQEKNKVIAAILKVLILLFGIVLIFLYWTFLDKSESKYQAKLNGDIVEEDIQVNIKKPYVDDISTNPVVEQTQGSSSMTESTTASVETSISFKDLLEEEDILAEEIGYQVKYLVERNDSLLTHMLIDTIEHSSNDEHAPVYLILDMDYILLEQIKLKFKAVYTPEVYEYLFSTENGQIPLYFETDGLLYYNDSFDRSWCKPLDNDKVISTRYEIIDKETKDAEIYIKYQTEDGEAEKMVTATWTDKGYRLNSFILE